jgi:plasmid maintenance system antidote protein VapI
VTALRLARSCRTTPEFWLKLQRDRELETAALASGERVEREVAPRAA